MSLCSNGAAALKKAATEIDQKLNDIVDKDVLPVTGKILELESNPAIQSVISLIPGAAPVQAAFNTALDYFSKADQVLKAPDLETKFVNFVEELKTLHPYAQQGILDKLAGVVSSILHGNTLATTTYDLAVMGNIMAAKAEPQAVL